MITNFAICPKTNPAAPPISDINCQVLMRVSRYMTNLNEFLEI